MIKTILVPLTGHAGDASALAFARSLAALVGATLDCVHFTPGPGQIARAAALGQFNTRMGTVEMIHAMQKDAEARKVTARQHYDEFARSGGVAQYRDAEGDEVDATIAEARFSDLVVLPRGEETGKFLAAEIGEILVSCGKPVVVAPLHPGSAGLGTTVLAWKETAEAARAVTAALPVLSKAERVIVLTACEDEDRAAAAAASAGKLAAQLARHGIKAESEVVNVQGRGDGTAIMEATMNRGAALLVMGAYGHSRRREWVFGGFTRDVLRDASLPVLLMH